MLRETVSRSVLESGGEIIEGGKERLTFADALGRNQRNRHRLEADEAGIINKSNLLKLAKYESRRDG
jgi:hypothetical protein